MGGAIRLALVTGTAGAYRVAPGIPAAPADRQDVVERKVAAGQSSPTLYLPRLNAAVGARVSVSPKNTPPAPASAAAGHVDEAAQADHSRDVQNAGDAPDLGYFRADCFHPALHYQGYGSPPGDHGQRFIGCVE
jgi:hypothetical protein